MLRNKLSLRTGWWLALLLVAGCSQAEAKPAWDDPYPDPDTPLEFTMNAKGQVHLRGRWVDVFGEYATVKDYLRERRDAYHQVYQQREIALPVVQQGRRQQEYIPITVKIEVDPQTKSGMLGSLKRMCREVGFIQFEVRVQGEEAPLPDLP